MQAKSLDLPRFKAFCFFRLGSSSFGQPDSTKHYPKKSVINCDHPLKYLKPDKTNSNPENTKKPIGKNCNSVLLVDDDDIDNTVNVRLFKQLNFTAIDICKNGREAMNHLRRLDTEKLPLPDLIMLDINMKVMNGYEFLREFKTLHFKAKDKMKIIVLTNMNSNRDKLTIESLGINFIEKPLTKEKLLEFI